MLAALNDNNTATMPWVLELKKFITNLRRAVRKESFRIRPPHVFATEKKPGSGKYRAISLFKLRDRVAMALCAKYLTALFDAGLFESACAFRNNGSAGPCRDSAVEDIIRFRKENAGELFVAEADIRGFYDTIDHSIVKKAFSSALGKARKHGTPASSTATRIFNASLRSYTFRGAQVQCSRRFKDMGVAAKLSFPREAMKAVHGNLHKSRLGIPQGGALSGLIANLVLDHADKAVTDAIGTEICLYKRYCDDMIIISPDRSVAEKAFNAYRRAVEKLGLSMHPPKDVVKYSRDFYDEKSKSVYRWADPEKHHGAVPRIQFLGYLLRHDAVLSIRDSTITKELAKQEKTGARIIEAARRSPKLSTGQIMAAANGRLVAMAVGKSSHIDDNSISAMCWASGFNLLGKHRHCCSGKLKLLDRGRTNQLARIRREVSWREGTGRRSSPGSGAPPAYLGSPYSYHGQFAKKNTDPTTRKAATMLRKLKAWCGNTCDK